MRAHPAAARHGKEVGQRCLRLLPARPVVRLLQQRPHADHNAVIVRHRLWQGHAPQLLQRVWRRQAALRGRQRRLRAALAPLDAGQPGDLHKGRGGWEHKVGGKPALR